MTQVKSSSHSPKCIEHSPYGPCIPECRIMKGIKVMPADYDWSQAAPKFNGFVPGSAPAKPNTMPPGVRPPGILSMDDYLDVDPMYADLFKEPGTLVKKGDLIGHMNVPIKQEFGRYSGVHQPLGHGLNIEFGGGSESVTDRETFQRNPYLLTNPRACLQHEMAWHWRDQITCDEFEADLDMSIGFWDQSDEAAMESRAFRVGQSGTVQVYANKYKQQKAAATVWKRIAFVAIPLGIAANIISAANAFNWWGL